MYEDFNYIADENLLNCYWLEEKVVCPQCQGTAQLLAHKPDQIIACYLCQGTGTIARQLQLTLNK